MCLQQMLSLQASLEEHSRDLAMQGREVGNEDCFHFNDGFTAQLFRVKINTIQLKETTEENKKTNDQVMQDRQYQVSFFMLLVYCMATVATRLSSLDHAIHSREGCHGSQGDSSSFFNIFYMSSFVEQQMPQNSRKLRENQTLISQWQVHWHFFPQGKVFAQQIHMLPFCRLMRL